MFSLKNIYIKTMMLGAFIFVLISGVAAGEKENGNVPDANPALSKDVPVKKEKMRKRHPGRGPRGDFDFFSKLAPEERAVIKKLAAEKNGKLLRETMEALRKKYRSPEDKKVDELSEKYLGAKTEAERSAIRKELEAAVKAQFDKRMEATARHIAAVDSELKKAERHLAKLKERYAKGIADSARIVKNITAMMCMPPDKRRPPVPSDGEPRGKTPFPPPPHGR